jgi:hypothetical protein
MTPHSILNGGNQQVTAHASEYTHSFGFCVVPDVKQSDNRSTSNRNPKEGQHSTPTKKNKAVQRLKQTLLQ